MCYVTGLEAVRIASVKCFGRLVRAGTLDYHPLSGSAAIAAVCPMLRSL